MTEYPSPMNSRKDAAFKTVENGLAMTSKQALSIRTSMRFLRDSFSRFPLAMIALGCACVPQGGESDVPCVVVPKWGFERLIFREDNDTLLITEESNKANHEVIMRFDPVLADFRRATEAEWNDATGTAETCCLVVLEEGGFRQAGTSLQFEETPISVAGGGVLGMSPTIPPEYVAVLSTNGLISSYSHSAGQHFHQVFSVATGEQVGTALRVGVGGIENSTASLDWGGRSRFVIYEQVLNILQPAGRRVCVVDVRGLDMGQLTDE